MINAVWLKKSYVYGLTESHVRQGHSGSRVQENAAQIIDALYSESTSDVAHRRDIAQSLDGGGKIACVLLARNFAYDKIAC
ncbi:hypothetical protein [Cronobacter condimenti]|nr:hypothetical protein [Cronobacter condimenti]